MFPLNQYAKNIYSQFGEDGIIEKILEKIPNDNYCVEFGAWDGVHLSNTANLILNKNYSAVLIEADTKKYEELTHNMVGRPVTMVNKYVTFDGEDTLDNILKSTTIPVDFDFLSIDIDGSDYFILESLIHFKPKVICIEFNPTIPNEVDYIQPKDFSISRGSSAKSITALAKTKNYELVSVTTCNLFFIHINYLPNFGLQAGIPLQQIRDDSEFKVYVFTGYDGTILLSKELVMPFHGLKAKDEEYQFLPTYLRRHKEDYNFLQHRLFNFFKLCRKIRNPDWVKIKSKLRRLL
jgi:hypothetical protein